MATATQVQIHGREIGVASLPPGYATVELNIKLGVY